MFRIFFAQEKLLNISGAGITLAVADERTDNYFMCAAADVIEKKLITNYFMNNNKLLRKQEHGLKLNAINGVAVASSCNPDIIPYSQVVEFYLSSSLVFSKTIGPYQTYFPTTTEFPRGYTYTVRYRNESSNGCDGPWVIPTETWYW